MEGTGARIRVLVADDDPLARELVTTIVEGDDGLELVASAEDADGAVQLAAEHTPDVAVLDWVMPGGGGPHAAQHIQEVSPATNIIALTAHDTEQAAFDMLRSGAKSYLFKGAPPEELVQTILNVARL